MDKKSIIGFVLMGLILFGYSWYVGKQSEKEREAYYAAQREQFIADSIDRAEHPEKYLHELQAANEEEARAAAVAEYQEQANQRLQAELERNFGESLTAALHGEEQMFTLENEVMTMQISNYGAKVADVTLKDYRKYS